MNIDELDQPPLGISSNQTTSPQVQARPMQNDSANNTHHSHPQGGRQSGNVTVYQTTGPEAYTSPIASPDGSGPALNPRSCVTCRRRKVRCDKQMPCSNCRRALIPCVFPAPGRAPRQPRPKDPNAPSKSSSQREVELVKRLRKLEGIVEELSGQIEVESGDKAASTGSPNSPTTTTTPAKRMSFGPPGQRAASDRGPSNSMSWSPQEMGTPSDGGSDMGKKKDITSLLGRIVLNDHKGSTRYVTNGFWAKINDELDALRQDAQRLTDDDSDSDYDDTPDHSPAVGSTPGSGLGNKGSEFGEHQAFMFGYRAADVDLQPYHPLPSQVPYLWSVYQENVEPMIKILHVPTTDLLMREARRNSNKLSPGNEALVFAIYYAAVISMEPEEITANFKKDRDELLQQYRFALEQSLARANFLYTSELIVLQAFAIFLIVVRRVDDSRFCWTLTGLIVRMAQGMGLHRDGSQFDMTPYEIEMRRRVWWAILVLDLRSAEEVGSDLTVPETSFDTQMPLNINDVDISPSSTETPITQESRSDTAVALARYEILMLSRRFLMDIASKNPELTAEDRERLLVDAYQRVETRFLQRIMDGGDALYWMAGMIARIVVAKMCLHIYQSRLFKGNETELSIEIRDRVFVAAIEVVELGSRLNADPRGKQFRWLFMTYTNWHAIAFNLIELCRRPWSALSERSWDAVVAFERDPVDLAKSGDHAAVFLPLRKLYLRARRRREAEIARLRNSLDDARRLDWQERMSPTTGRFGPIPGEENHMERAREKWWSLVRPDGPMPRALNQQYGGIQTPNFASANPTSVPNMGTMPPSGAGTASTNTLSPGQMGLTPTAIEVLDDIMAQPNPNIGLLWTHINRNGDGGMGLAMDGTNPTTDGQGQRYAENNALRQQALALQAQASASRDAETPTDMPAWLWTHAWGEPAEAKVEDVPELDMMEGDFNWTDWGQTLQNFDMMGMQPPM